MRKINVLCAAASLVIVAAAEVKGAAILEFSGGNGTAQVDQYAGAAGDGWLEAWQEQNGNGVLATVVNTTPVRTGGGNYLEITTDSALAGGGNTGITRQVTAYADQTYLVSLDIRIDQIPTAASQAVIVSLGGDRQVGTTSKNLVEAFFAVGGQWVVNGSSNGGTIGEVVTAGTIYHFDFTVDPVNKKYDVTLIANPEGDTKVFTRNNIGFRNTTASEAELTNPFLELGTSGGGFTGTSKFSVDNIAIPEPAAFGLLSAAAPLALARKRR